MNNDCYQLFNEQHAKSKTYYKHKLLNFCNTASYCNVISTNGIDENRLSQPKYCKMSNPLNYSIGCRVGNPKIHYNKNIQQLYFTEYIFEMEIQKPKTQQQRQSAPVEVRLFQSNRMIINPLCSPLFLVQNQFIFSSGNQIATYSLTLNKIKIFEQLEEDEVLIGLKLSKNQQNSTLITYIKSNSQKSLICCIRQYNQNINKILPLPISTSQNLTDFNLIKNGEAICLVLECDGEFKLKVIDTNDGSLQQHYLQQKCFQGFDYPFVNGFCFTTGLQICSHEYNFKGKQNILYTSKSQIILCTNLNSSILVVQQKSITLLQYFSKNQYIKNKIQIQVDGNILKATIDLNKQYIALTTNHLKVLIFKIKTMAIIRSIQVSEFFSSIQNIIISTKGSYMLICGEGKASESVVLSLNADLFSSKSQHYYPFHQKLNFVYKHQNIQIYWHNYRKQFYSLIGQNFKFGTTEETFSQIPITCSVHPQGYFAIFGFNHLIKLYGIKTTSLQIIQTINAKSVIKLQCSPYGNILIAHFKTQIRIYNLYTLEKISSLGMRFPATQIIGFQQQDKGNRLFIYDNGLGATVFNYQTLQVQRQFRLPIVGFPISYDFTDEIVIQVDKERVVLTKGQQNIVKQTSYYDLAIITSIAISKQLNRVFFGTLNGEVRCHFWYQTPVKIFICNYIKIGLFSSPVRSMNLNHNATQLIACSTGGETSILGINGTGLQDFRQKQKYFLLQSKMDNIVRINEIQKTKNQHLNISQLMSATVLYKSELQQKYLQDSLSLLNNLKSQPTAEFKDLSQKIKKAKESLELFDITSKKQELWSEFCKKLIQIQNERDELIQTRESLIKKSHNKNQWISKVLYEKCVNYKQQKDLDLQLKRGKTQYIQKNIIFPEQADLVLRSEVDNQIFSQINKYLLQSASDHTLQLVSVSRIKDEWERKNSMLQQNKKQIQWKMLCARQLRDRLQFVIKESTTSLNQKQQLIETLKTQAQHHSIFLDGKFGLDQTEFSEIQKLKTINITNWMQNMTKMHREHLVEMDGQHKELVNKVASVEQNLKKEAKTMISLDQKLILNKEKLKKLKSQISCKTHQLYMVNYNLDKFYKQLQNYKNQYCQKYITLKRKPEYQKIKDNKRMQKKISIKQKQCESQRMQFRQNQTFRNFRNHNIQNQNLTKQYNSLNVSVKESKRQIRALAYRINKVRLSHQDRSQSKTKNSGFRSPFVEYQQQKKLRAFRSHNVSLSNIEQV